MRKLKVAVVVIVLGAIVVLGGAALINGTVTGQVEDRASEALGLKTEVEAVRIGYLKGGVSIEGVQIANVEGYEAKRFLTLGRADLDLAVSSLLADRVRAPSLVLQHVEVFLEHQGLRPNYAVVLERLRQAQKQRPPSDEKQKEFVIDELRIEDVKVHVRITPPVADLGTFDLAIPIVRLEKVGAEGERGVVIADLTRVVVIAILEAAVQRAATEVPGRILDDLGKDLGDLQVLKDLGVSVIESVGKKAIEKLDEATSRSPDQN